MGICLACGIVKNPVRGTSLEVTVDGRNISSVTPNV
jgi:hypothetical protein